MVKVPHCSNVGDNASLEAKLNAQIERANAFAHLVLGGEEVKLKKLIRAAAGEVKLDHEVVDDLRQQTQTVSKRLCKLSSFIDDCRDALQRLAATEEMTAQGSLERSLEEGAENEGAGIFCESCPKPLSAKLVCKADAVGLHPDCLQHCIVALGDIYECLRQHETGGIESADVWVPPETFERSTKKFIVTPRNGFVVRAAMAEHLPVLVMDRPNVDHVKGVPKDFLRVADKSWVSSQYFDSESFDCYNTRVQKLENSKCYRVRWYGRPGQTTLAPQPPTPDQAVFFERKIHHNDGPSVKERFKLSCQEVPGFLAGSQMPNLSSKNEVLAAEIQGEMQGKKMAPVLRTMCARTAFQSTSTNSLRVSFDDNLVFLNEQDGCRRFPASPGWYSTLRHDGELSLTFSDYKLLEIKLGSDETLPQWVEELQASGLIIPMPSISKFGHGICLFNSKVLVFKPYWFDSVVGRELGTIRGSQQLVTPSNSSEDNHDVGESWESSPKKTSRCYRFLCFRRASAKTPTAVSSGGLVVPQRPPKAAQAKTFFANERTLLQWISPVSLILTFAIGLTSVGASGNEATRARVVPVGLAMMGMSVLWLFYALHIYFKRMQRIRTGDMDGFDETFGPTVIVMGLLFLVVGSMVLTIFTPSSVSSTNTNQLTAAAAAPTTTSTPAAMATTSITNGQTGSILSGSVSLNLANLDKWLSNADIQSTIAKGIAHIHV